MWLFIIAFIFNVGVRHYIEKFAENLQIHIKWIDEQLVKIHENNNVEQEKVDWVEQNYLPKLKYWRGLAISHYPIYILITANIIVYIGGIVTLNEGQNAFANTIITMIEAGLIILVINIYQKTKESIQMTYNVNDLTIESMGLKEQPETNGERRP